jgi:DNA-binding MarR family transcriptional regulator
MAFFAVKRAFQVSAVGVDPGAFPVLHHLAATGPCRQGALAEALGLAVRGLVDTARDPEDGRATVLSISDAGLAFLSERLRAHRTTLQTAIEDFTEQERAELVRLLSRLAAALGEPKECA